MCQVLGTAVFYLFCPWSPCVSPSAAETGSEVRGELGFESTSPNPLGLEAVHLVTIMGVWEHKGKPSTASVDWMSTAGTPTESPVGESRLYFPRCGPSTVLSLFFPLSTPPQPECLLQTNL